MRCISSTISSVRILLSPQRIWIDEIDTHNIDDPRLPSNVLWAPSEVARFQTQGTIFDVSTARAHRVYALMLAGLSKPGVCRLTAELELALLAVIRTLGTGRRALVSWGARNTYWSNQRGKQSDVLRRKATDGENAPIVGGGEETRERQESRSVDAASN